MPDSNDSNGSTPSNASLVTDGGIVYRDPNPPRRHLRVAPTVADVTNTIALETWPLPTACARLEYSRFAFDSSFPHPTMSAELAAIFNLRAPGTTDGDKLAVFGHADPIGDEAYNKTLGGRRAKAIYALLTRQPALWDDLHQGAFQGDKWGVESLQTCLTQLGYDVGAIDGKVGPLFRAGIHAFKQDNGLADDGSVDASTRLALFGGYMDSLTADQGGTARAYDPTDFVGEGKEPDLRGAFQGCGERNLAVVLSKDETNELAPDSQRDARIRAQRPKQARTDLPVPAWRREEDVALGVPVREHRAGRVRERRVEQQGRSAAPIGGTSPHQPSRQDVRLQVLRFHRAALSMRGRSSHCEPMAARWKGGGVPEPSGLRAARRYARAPRTD